MIITSVHNERIKHLTSLQQKSTVRRREGLIVVEGLRELRHCLEAGFNFKAVFFCRDICDGRAINLPDAETIEVNREVYNKIAYRGSTEGVVAVAEHKELTLSDLKLKENPLIVVLESVEKPGNLGAVLRSCDAAQVDALIVCDPLTDLYNPNVIRSSLGGIFTVPTVACTSDECIGFLKSRNVKILTAQLQDSKPYYATDMTVATAIVMGTESTGLTDKWRVAADEHILIPMKGKLDSLNVSVSAAILVFEAVRQRQAASVQL